MRAGWGILLFIIVCAAAFFAVSASHLLPSKPDAVSGQSSPELPPLASIFGETILCLIVILATFSLARIERRPVVAYGLGTSKALRLFFQGAGSGLVLLSLLVLVLWQTNLLVFDRLLLGPIAILEYGAVWALGFLAVALFEETLLRGYLQFTLARGCTAIFRRFMPARRSQTFGFWTAATILCFIFALGHSANGGESLFGLFAVGVFGLTFVYSLWRTGSLWWGIGAHTSWNWAQSFLYGVGNSGNMISHHLLASHPVGQVLLSGGPTGPEGSLLVLPTLAGLALSALFAVQQTVRFPNRDD